MISSAIRVLLTVSCAALLSAETSFEIINGAVVVRGAEPGGRVEIFAEVGSDDPPPVLGKQAVVDGWPAFQPKYPLAPGLGYRVAYREPNGSVRRGRVSIAKVDRAPSTRLEAIYPTASELPENQLKFYFQFSAAMSRGEAYKHVRLEKPDGKTVSLPFLELDQELWDPSGTRLTIFFDPGRVKRGLLLMEEAGVPIEEGKRYTLVVSEEWLDAEGLQLTARVEKPFRVTVPDREPPDPASWTIAAPKPDTRARLRVEFPEPLDRALLERVVEVQTIGGRVLAGSIDIDNEERRWSFIPDEPWKAGRYYLVAAVYLEDLAGNSIERPFEVDTFEKAEDRIERKQARVEFQVR